MATKIFFCFAQRPGGYHVILGDLAATKLVGFLFFCQEIWRSPCWFFFFLTWRPNGQQVIFFPLLTDLVSIKSHFYFFCLKTQRPQGCFSFFPTQRPYGQQVVSGDLMATLLFVFFFFSLGDLMTIRFFVFFP